MHEFERKPPSLLYATDDLKRLILEYPDYPLLVFAGEESNSGDWRYMNCSWVHAEVGEFLDCMQIVNEEKCYIDRDDFADDLADYIYDFEYHDWDGSDNEWDDYVARRTEEYDPYWRTCIILYVNN